MEEQSAAGSRPTSVDPSYQNSEGQPPKAVKMGESVESIDGEEVVNEDGDIKLTGFKAESRFSSGWCGWFSRCCPSNSERNPLLTPEPTRKFP